MPQTSLTTQNISLHFIHITEELCLWDYLRIHSWDTGLWNTMQALTEHLRHEAVAGHKILKKKTLLCEETYLPSHTYCFYCMRCNLPVLPSALCGHFLQHSGLLTAKMLHTQCLGFPFPLSCLRTLCSQWTAALLGATKCHILSSVYQLSI